MPCLNCPINNCRKLPDQQFTETDVLIIVDNPTQRDIAKQQLLSDTGGEMLREVLPQLNINNWQVTSAINCLPPEGRIPSRKELKECKPRLLEVIKVCKPKALLVLGAQSCHTLFDKSQDRGKWLDYEGILAIYTYAPGYILGNRKKFSEWVAHIEKICEPNTNKWEEYTWEILDTEQKVVNYLSECLKQPKIALDYETTSLNPFGSKKQERAIPICATISYDGKHSVLVPCHLLMGRARNLYKIMCETKIIAGSNFADYDWKISHENFDIETKHVNDTVIRHYLLDENAGENGLKQLAQLYLNAPDWETPMKPYIKNMASCPMSIMGPYATCDAIATYRLDNYLEKRMNEEGLSNLYNTLFRQSIPLLSKMSCHGVRIDTTKSNLLGAKLNEEITELKAKINEEVGHNIFVTKGISTEKLAKYFFEEKKYPVISASKKTGNPSTDAKVRNVLISRYDDNVAKLINEFNDVSKLKSTYVDGLEDRLDDEGRIHAHFLLQITATGRLSGRDPNLQNIPKRKESGKIIRTLFLPDEGQTFFDCDYSNLEVRVGALESNDPILTEMINSGIDVHKRVASMIYGVDEDEVTKEQRTNAKTGTFGVMYGMTHEGASYRLGLSKDDALLLVQGVKEIFRGLAEWADYMCNFALENNYVISRVGRVRRFPLIINAKDIESIKRRAVNTPIQGLASDICLNAAYNLKQKMGKILTPQILVHDSICGSIREVTEENTKQIKEIMTKLPFPSNVKFDVDCAFGPNWGDVCS